MGTPITQYGWITIYPKNILYGTAVSLRLAVMSVITALFLVTTSLRDIVVALKKLKVPYVVSFTLALCLRFAQMFATDWGIIAEALKSRGYDLRQGKTIEKLRKLGAILMPLMVISIRRTESVTNAIELRAFKMTEMKRTFYFDLGMQLKDWFIAVTLVSTISVVWLFRYFFGFFVL
jgi:energy-coupling factor transport system permease protein